MKKLLIFIIFVPQILFSQTITNYSGEVFDVRNIEKGSIVTYEYDYCGPLCWTRTLEVDGEIVFRFGRGKDCEIIINGKKQPRTKKIGTLIFKFFYQYDFKLMTERLDYQMWIKE